MQVIVAVKLSSQKLLTGEEEYEPNKIPKKKVPPDTNSFRGNADIEQGPWWKGESLH